MSFLQGVSAFSLRDEKLGHLKGLRVGPGEGMGRLSRMPPLGRFSGTSNRRGDRWRMSPSLPGKPSGEQDKVAG